jgi:terminase small subunit / prophage DNA-packing protein
VGDVIDIESPLDVPATQERFGELVGISQQAVSDLLGREVIVAGASLSAWLLDYTSHLREQAAGRGADGELARERARLAREQADRIAMENAESRKEVAPIALITVVLGKLAGDVAGILNGLVPRVRRRVPDISSDVLRIIEDEMIRVRLRAASVSLADAEDHDDDDEDQP